MRDCTCNDWARNIVHVSLTDSYDESDQDAAMLAKSADDFRFCPWCGASLESTLESGGGIG